MGHGDHRVLIRDQVFHGHVIIISNGSAPVIPVFIGDYGDLLLDDCEKLFLICQDGL